MKMVEVLNLIAIVLAPILAILIGQWMQNNSEKRKDKLAIFKTLMIARNGWSYESVRALNIIDIVFSDEKEVIKNWKEYYDKLRIENPTETDLQKIKESQYKLIESIAISLGYKDKITWETIQNPYYPKGMFEAEKMQRELQNGHLALAQMAEIIKNIVPNQIQKMGDNEKSIK